MTAAKQTDYTELLARLDAGPTKLALWATDYYLDAAAAIRALQAEVEADVNRLKEVIEVCKALNQEKNSFFSQSCINLQRAEAAELREQAAAAAAIEQAAKMCATIGEDWRAVGDWPKVYATDYLVHQIRSILPSAVAEDARRLAQDCITSVTDEDILRIAARETDTLDATRVHEQRKNGWHATTIFDGDAALLRFARAAIDAALSASSGPGAEKG